MTVFFATGVIDALPISSDTPYLVALSPSGIVVGSISVASTDLIGGQAQLAVWGDDSVTPELDGLLSGEVITFQLVDGDFLYHLNLINTVGSPITFITNGASIVINASAEIVHGNSSCVRIGCTDDTACNYDSYATDDDSSCEYPETNYDCNGDCLNDTDGDGVCDELEVVGCTNVTACNYDS